jgi:hypothetical protein
MLDETPTKSSKPAAILEAEELQRYQKILTFLEHQWNLVQRAQAALEEAQFVAVEGTPPNYNLILVPSGGNVGIGTTAPDYKLEVAGNSCIGNKALCAGWTNEIWTQPQTDGEATLVINHRGLIMDKHNIEILQLEMAREAIYCMSQEARAK